MENYKSDSFYCLHKCGSISVYLNIVNALNIYFICNFLWNEILLKVFLVRKKGGEIFQCQSYVLSFPSDNASLLYIIHTNILTQLYTFFKKQNKMTPFFYIQFPILHIFFFFCGLTVFYQMVGKKNPFQYGNLGHLGINVDSCHRNPRRHLTDPLLSHNVDHDLF